MATSFSSAIIRGAGTELGRSAMRTVLNPVLKGLDSTPVNVTNSSSKNFVLLNERTIKVGKESSFASTVGHFVGCIFALVFLFPLGIGLLFSKISDLKKPIFVHTLDRPYFKADGRSRTGFLPDQKAVIINTEELENPGKKMLSTFRWTAWICVGLVTLVIVSFILS
jgi:hypothetical protein